MLVEGTHLFPARDTPFSMDMAKQMDRMRKGAEENSSNIAETTPPIKEVNNSLQSLFVTKNFDIQH